MNDEYENHNYSESPEEFEPRLVTKALWADPPTHEIEAICDCNSHPKVQAVFSDKLDPTDLSDLPPRVYCKQSRHDAEAGILIWRGVCLNCNRLFLFAQEKAFLDLESIVRFPGLTCTGEPIDE